MIQKYKKGYMAEWNLTRELSELGYLVLRAPHSGASGLPSPDIVALKNNNLFVIECKAHASGFKIEQDQLDQLKLWQTHGAKAYICWKIARKGWHFMHLDDVMANNGNVGKKFALEKSFKIDFFKSQTS